MSFGLLTLNLWNINEPLAPRYRALAAGLKKLRLDIVCLQEADRDPKSERPQAELLAEMCGLKHHVEESGLAILSAPPVVRLSKIELPQLPDDPPRSALLAEFLIDGRPLLVINTHLAYLPEHIEGRRKQIEALLRAIQRQYSDPRGIAKVLCGDFNDVPDSPAVSAILNSDDKFSDAFAKCQSNSAGFTYSPRNPYVERSWTLDERIDYIFVNASLTPKDCMVVFDGTHGFDFASDHFGVTCRLEFH